MMGGDQSPYQRGAWPAVEEPLGLRHADLRALGAGRSSCRGRGANADELLWLIG
jgi:hypothetical protein